MLTVRVMYEDVVVGTIATNHSLSVGEALELLRFDEEEFLDEQGWDALDYNDFRFES